MNSPAAIDLDTVWRDAWRPPEKYKPSEWAAKHRYLPPEVSAEPGRWRNERTPYLVGIMDAVVDEAVEEIVFLKPTQIGGSEFGRNVIGYWIDNDPGPCMIVMPDEKSAEEAVRERLQPMIRQSPSLAKHLSARREDNKLSCIALDSMSIYIGWAGSPQSLASRPCRYLDFDELDKYPPFAGSESDPVSLGMERTKTYLHRKRVLKKSTPTTRQGPIWRAWEACGDRRYFHVPCPHCGVYQRLVWTQVKWPKLDEGDQNKYADHISVNRLAWYECAKCGGRIEDRNKPAMLLKGVWASEGQEIDVGGAITGDRPKSPRVGFHLNSLYSPWVKFCDMVAKFILAKGDIGATMNFKNSWLAEPFETQITRREPSKIRVKSEEAKHLGASGAIRVVPQWAVLLIATADVQKDHCYWIVTAWGYEQQSKRLAIGVSATLDEVYQQVFSPSVPFVSEQGGVVQNTILVVDSGFRKDEVTDFARRDTRRVHIAKGLSTYFGPIAEQKVEKASGVVVWNINTMQSKDTLDRLIESPDSLKWQVYPDIGEEYCHQLSSEHKILNPQTKQQEWVQKTSGAANHFWDCEAMACAVATAMGAAVAKPPESKAIEPARSSANRPDFMPERPTGWTNR